MTRPPGTLLPASERLLRGDAALKHYKTLKHVSLCPTTITKIARSVVVLMSLHYDPDWQSW